MNLKLLGAFALALLVVLVLPLIGGMLRSGGTAMPVSAEAFVPPASAGTAVAPSASSGVASVATGEEAAIVIPSIVEAPPMLDEVSLIGTVWQVSHKMGTIDVNLMGNGVATARHQLLGNIQATWRVEGADIVVTANVMNKTETIRVQMRGTELYYQGVAIQRLR